MPLCVQVDVGRLDVAVNEPRRTQIDEGAAKVHRQIDRAELRHGVVG